MIGMVVRNNDKVNVPCIDPQFVHVFEQDVAVGACVKEDGLLRARDHTGESPVGPAILAQGVIVIKNSDLDGRAIRLGPGLLSRNGRDGRKKK